MIEGPGAAATLKEIVEDLAGVLEVLTAPKGLDVPVGSVTIHDVSDADRIEVHDVVLAVGLRTHQAALSDLVRAVGASGGCAVLVKTAQDVRTELAEVSRLAGVAVIGVAPEITWAQLHALLRTSIASAGISAESGVRVPIGDLFALANAVAAMVGGPTTIEDPRSRCLAYSSDGSEIDEPRRQTILGRQVPNEWVDLLTSKGFFKQLWASRDVVRIDDLAGDGSLRPRMAIAVRAGDEVLGSIWVAETKTPFDEHAEQALREAAESRRAAHRPQPRRGRPRTTRSRRAAAHHPRRARPG